MFGIEKLFGNKIVAETVVKVASEKAEKPVKSDAAPAGESSGRRGRTLTAEALQAHDAVLAALTDTAQTRSTIIARLPEQFRDYANGNWQGLIGRLVAQNKAKLASEHGRGRNVAYAKV